MMVTSVTTSPAWCVGRYSCSAFGNTRKLRSRKKMTMQVKMAAVDTWTMWRTCQGAQAPSGQYFSLSSFFLSFFFLSLREKKKTGGAWGLAMRRVIMLGMVKKTATGLRSHGIHPDQ